MFLAAEGTGEVVLKSGWFLEHAYIIPVIPAIAFVLIMLFGKKLGWVVGHGSYFGIASMAASFVLSAGCVIQWIQRVNSATSGEGESALGRTISAVGRSLVPMAEGGETKAYISPVIKTFAWWQSGGTTFGIGSHADGLAIMLIFVVTLISTLVQIYSLEYVRGDRRFTHFFGALTLFSAGMLAMVLAENTIQLILGWEIMGLCSFMLIGHWWEERANSEAALKAFWTVRVGDIGLLVGVTMMYFGAKSFSIDAINEWALTNPTGTRVVFWTAMALLAAVIGKSGQFPLHTWLPDAMAGPTPVSSLLHSSTMVVAGVFLVARLYPVFWVGFSIADGGINPLVLIGGITILISGLLALVQVDIKKVLAYSTVGQLGYMIMGLGAGAWTPAVFHIFTHAFFKACLFLGAGSISHSASHHSFDMKKDMGGLWRKMPWTFATFLISTIALIGLPPFAGFFSKDEIIDNAGHNGYQAFMVIGLIGAFLTAAYMSRTMYLTFFGTARGASAGLHADPHDAHGAAPTMEPIEEYEADDAAHGHAHDTHGAHGGHDAHAGPHESPWLIVGPLVVLAFGAVFAGYLNAAPFGEKWLRFEKWAEPSAVGKTFPELSHAEFLWSKASISIGIVLAAVVIGLGLSKMVYERKFLFGLTRRNPVAGFVYRFLWNKYYLDWLYEKVIARGVAYPIARAAYWINQNVLDGVVNGAGKFSVGSGRWVYKWIDQRGVDGIVNGSGMTAKGAGSALRGTESGRIQQYASLLFGATAVAAIALVLYVQAK